MELKGPFTVNPSAIRINSIDFFRGITMFLLAGESTNLFAEFNQFNSPVMRFLANQLSHHDWHGMHFWDLIQPFFMFVVGVSIPFAVANRIQKGDTIQSVNFHAFKRSFLLLFLGWSIYCIGSEKIVWHFQNVLAQLSVTYLIAFLIRNRSITFQLIFSLILLLLIDLSYRFFPVEGFNHPWINFENLGTWVNTKIEGGEKAGEWASLNAVSTTAHTIWGVLCGKILMTERSAQSKIKIFILAGTFALVIGYTLDIMSITPIIKKIATSSFVFASGGWAILTLCLLYWLIDIRKSFASGYNTFKVVGMNSIFIYLFFETGFGERISRYFHPFTNTFFSWNGTLTVEVMNSIIEWMSLWYICYWLYKNRIFIKI